MNSRHLCALSVAIASLFATSCKRAFTVSTAAYIIGNNDIETIDKDTKDKIPEAHLNAAVVLAVMLDGGRRKFCSGTMIPPAEGESNYRIVTNYHCFQPSEDAAATPEMMANPCENTHVFFGFYKGETEDHVADECQPDSFRSDFEGDLAVFTLKNNPPDRFKPLQIWQDGAVPEGRTARVVHFPIIDQDDPEIRDKEAIEPTVGIDLPLGQVTLADCATLGTFPKNEWQLDKSLPMGIKHTCDLKHGSSGSALVDTKTMKILGVNWGGITLRYKNPDRTVVYNVASSADYLLNFLGEKVSGEKTARSLEANADSTAAVEKASQKTEKKKTFLGQKCGVIGDQNERPLSLVFLFMLWLLPLACIRHASENKARR